ncbi:hypothetical protein LTR84_006529 [Exophiala bonariae]|uniref:HNH nuclease domain-containing protein n=1 Tax=Exophiala bonariae TaxID=1690606 RepID=A0AAV9N3P9_9EURO|nr:hypothetical protein LTR84_006529 [Exophiala bonariae]
MSQQPPCSILSAAIILPAIKSVKQQKALNYYGSVQSSITIEASKFLASVTDIVETEAVSTIESFLLATQNDCVGDADQKNACWLTIRATAPSDAFEVPRWHQDGRMFPCDEGREDITRSKYALTMLGPTTLMLHPDTQIFRTFHEGEFKHYWWLQTSNNHEPTEEEEDQAIEALRYWLYEELEEAPQLQVKDGEVVRFSWGRKESPIHSEPDLISDRVFMTVLYGSETELRGMCEWRNAMYGEFDWE